MKTIIAAISINARNLDSRKGWNSALVTNISASMWDSAQRTERYEFTLKAGKYQLSWSIRGLLQRIGYLRAPSLDLTSRAPPLRKIGSTRGRATHTARPGRHIRRRTNRVGIVVTRSGRLAPAVVARCLSGSETYKESFMRRRRRR
jgi:hypothetical protein